MPLYPRDTRDDVPVISRMERDATGIRYTVEVETLDPSAYEQGEANVILWSVYIKFGNTRLNRAAGEWFVEAARTQDRIAEAVFNDKTSTCEELIAKYKHRTIP